MRARATRALLACLSAGGLAFLVVLAAHALALEGVALAVTAGLAAAAAALAGLALLSRPTVEARVDDADLVRRLDVLAARQVEQRDELRADLAEVRALLERPGAPGGR